MKKLLLQRISIVLLLAAIATGFITGCKKKTTDPTSSEVATFTSFSPSSAVPGSDVTITGNNFNTTITSNTITINGINAVIKTLTATQIIFTVPANATTGKIVLTTAGTVLTSNSNFTVIPAAPTITGFIPAAGALPNSVISITGTNFSTRTDSNTVTINGVAATVSSVTATEVVVTIPATATTGKVVLTTGKKTITSTTDLKVTHGIQSTYADLGLDFVHHLELFGINAAGDLFGCEPVSITKVPFGGAPVQIVSIYANNLGFKGMWGMAMDKSGNSFFSERSSRIIKITPNGVISTFAGKGGASGYKDGKDTAARFTEPLGMTIDASGNLYVWDLYRIRKITPDGTVTTLAGSGIKGDKDGTGTDAMFGIAQGATIDNDGNIYLAELQNFKIKKITPAGVVTTFAGSGVSGLKDGIGKAAQFKYTQGMAVDAAGNVFVSDNDFGTPVYTIRMINKLGVVTTFLRGTKDGEVTNGPLSAATTSFPNGIVFDSAGSMYISNTYANVISKITFQ